MNSHIKLSENEDKALGQIEINNIFPAKNSNKINVNFTYTPESGRSKGEIWSLSDEELKGLGTDDLKKHLYNIYPKDEEERAIASLAVYLDDEDIDFPSLLKEYQEGNLDINRDRDGAYSIEYDGEVYVVITDKSAADSHYEDALKADIEDNPEAYNLTNYLYVSETDRRLIAGDEASNIVDNMSESDIIEEGGASEYEELESEYDEKIDPVQEKIEELEGQLVAVDDENSEYISGIENQITELQGSIETLEQEKSGALEGWINTAKEDISERIYDEWYDGLNDPIRFLEYEKGMYAVEDIPGLNFVRVDYDKATEDIFGNEGLKYYMETYDGVDNVEEVPRHGCYIGKR